MSPFRGISMELHQTNLASLVRSNGVMSLEQVAALGISLVRTRRAYSVQLDHLRLRSDIDTTRRPRAGDHPL